MTKLKKAFSQLDLTKKDKDNLIPGVLGFTINGVQVVEVSNRNGFVYVRLRDNLNEVVQAYNDAVSPAYGLAVLLYRDDVDKTRYRIHSRDTGRYQDWGSYSAYLPRHGSQHSFALDGTGGGDIVWVYGNQMMPLLGMPSGSVGSMGVVVGEYNHYYNGSWQAAGNTGTADLSSYKPTGTSARMLLVYMDANGNPNVRASDKYFSESITGSSAVMPYMPALQANEFPVAGVRLVSGTNVIAWANVYDVRDHYGGWLKESTITGNEYFICVTGSASLANERVLTAGEDVTLTDNGAGSTITVGVSTGTFARAIHAHEYGNINGSGTANQVSYFTDADTLSSTSNIIVTGTSVFIGGTTNGIKIEDGGRLSLIGTATVFDDLQMQLIGQRLESPASDIVQNNAEGTLSFKATATLVDYVSMNVQNTHRWATGTNLHPHLHWLQSSPLMPNWMIQVRVQVNGQQKATTWVNHKWTTNAYTYTTGTLNQMSEFGEIQVTGTYSISDIIQFRIIRDGDNGSGLFTGSSDGLAANAEALSFDLHIELARMGSNQEYAY